MEPALLSVAEGDLSSQGFFLMENVDLSTAKSFPKGSMGLIECVTSLGFNDWPVLG
jgi:hypothetical protein